MVSVVKTSFENLSKVNVKPLSFGSDNNSDVKPVPTEDMMLEPTFTNKVSSDLKTIKRLPGYVKRGMQGDPDANFYEFMQITKIPYYIGGPGLVAMILAGKNMFDIRANKAAEFNGKGMALGCALYYVATSLAQKCIDIPVKAFRGVDLNTPYVDSVATSAKTPDGISPNKIEQHKVFESADFARWDLLYNKDAKTPEDINARYNKIAHSMNASTDKTNDADNEVKPVIVSLIKQSRAWKYIASGFAVMIGVGLGNQKVMKDEFCTGMFSNFRQKMANLPKSIRNASIKNIAGTVNMKVLKPVGKSIVALWKGNEASMMSKVAGKMAIIGFLGSIIGGNISILKSTDLSKNKLVEKEEADA